MKKDLKNNVISFPFAPPTDLELRRLASGEAGNVNTPFDVEELKKSNVMGIKIAELRRKAGMNQRQLSEALREYNISITANALSKWEKGEAFPNSFQLFALSMIFGVDEIIPTFTGLKPVAAEYTPDLSRKGQNLLNQLKDLLVASGKFEPTTRRRPNAEPEPQISVNIFDEPAAAGTGNFVDDPRAESIDYPVSIVPDGTDFGIRVSGQSMMPRYVDGQIVFVEQCRFLNERDIGVFMYNGNAYIKQYTEEDPSEDEQENYVDSYGCVHPKIVLHSLNPEYDDIPVEPDSVFYIVGRVLN